MAPHRKRCVNENKKQIAHKSSEPMKLKGCSLAPVSLFCLPDCCALFSSLSLLFFAFTCCCLYFVRRPSKQTARWYVYNFSVIEKLWFRASIITVVLTCVGLCWLIYANVCECLSATVKQYTELDEKSETIFITKHFLLAVLPPLRYMNGHCRMYTHAVLQQCHAHKH